MKKVVTVVISVVLALVVLVTAGVNVVYYLLSGDEYTRMLSTSKAEQITVTNEGKTVELDSDSDEYKNIVKMFNHKWVKVKTDHMRFHEKGKFQIDIKTPKRTYKLLGNPMIETGSGLESKVEFVLYDASDYNIMEYFYFIVTVSKDDFLKIFPNAVEQIESEMDESDDHSSEFNEYGDSENDYQE